MEKSEETTEATGETYGDVRLSKRLAYILRYGAEKEGLQVKEGGWVSLIDLTKVPMMKWYNMYDLMKEVINSKSHRGTNRYEKKHENGIVYIRALYGRRMERNPCHSNSHVYRLVEICMDKICGNLDMYDLEDFPDEFLINSMIHRLRRQKRLNNKSFRCLLVPVIEHLDLGSIYITEATIKMVAQRCPNVRVLTLRDTGYMLTDNLMEWLLKRIPLIECLNLSGCHHLTDRTINALCKNCKNLQQLSISRIPSITQEGILKLVTMCSDLKHLDIFDNQNVSEEGRTVLEQVIAERGMTVILDGLKCEEDDITTKAMMCSTASGDGGDSEVKVKNGVDRCLALASAGDYF